MTKLNSVLLAGIFAIIVLISSAFAEHYCTREGLKPLFKSDSIVSVKFDPEAPNPQVETFAVRMDCLDNNFPPEDWDRDFYIYHVSEGYSVDTALILINNEPDIQFAFPSFNDSM